MFELNNFIIDIPQVGRFHTYRDDYLVWVMLQNQTAWEPHVIEVLERFLHPEAVVLDVGAHIGFHTVYCAKRAAQVHAFELFPRNRWVLNQNLGLNQCGNVSVHPFGLWNQKERRDHVWIPASCVNTGCVRLETLEDVVNMPQTKVSVAVDLRRLDDWVHEHDITRIDLIKVDIEGAEPQFLEGARETFQRFHPVVIMENFHPEQQDLLMDWGYTRERIVPYEHDYLYTFPSPGTVL